MVDKLCLGSCGGLFCYLLALVFVVFMVGLFTVGCFSLWLFMSWLALCCLVGVVCLGLFCCYCSLLRLVWLLWVIVLLWSIRSFCLFNFNFRLFGLSLLLFGFVLGDVVVLLICLVFVLVWWLVWWAFIRVLAVYLWTCVLLDFSLMVFKFWFTCGLLYLIWV